MRKSLCDGTGSFGLSKTSQSSRPQARIKCQFVLSGGVNLGQNTLRPASVEFVRKQRTNYARSRVQPFQTRTQPRGSRLRACQNGYFDKLTGTSLMRRSRFCHLSAVLAQPVQLCDGGMHESFFDGKNASIGNSICPNTSQGLSAPATPEFGHCLVGTQ